MSTGYSENVELDEGVNPHGVRTIIKFEGESLIIQKQQDMTEALAHVQAMRERNEGKGWGEGKEVGHIPALVHGRIAAIRDRDERKKAIKRFFANNPAFCAYPAYLKR